MVTTFLTSRIMPEAASHAHDTCPLSDNAQQTRHIMKFSGSAPEGGNSGDSGSGRMNSHALIRQLEEQVKRQQEEIETLRDALCQEGELWAARATLTAMIAHEMGGPLSLIRARSSLLSKRLEQFSREKIIQFLTHIEAQVSQMTDLLNDLIFINKAPTSQEILRAEPFDLKAFCGDVVRQISQRWPDRCITLICSDEVDRAVLDRRLVRYLLSNLLSNALKYSADKSEVRLEVRVRAFTAFFTVSDQGIGIPEDELGSIFTPFFRASNAAGVSGMGLGLSMVRTSVEAHGGTIQVESVPGCGTTFIAALPFQDRQL